MAIVLRTPELEKFTRIEPIGILGLPILPKRKLDIVVITLVTLVADVVIDAIVTVLVVMVEDDVTIFTNPPGSGSEAGDTGSSIELTALSISEPGTVSISSKYKLSLSCAAVNWGMGESDLISRSLISFMSTISVMTGIESVGGGDLESLSEPFVRAFLSSLCFLDTLSGIRSTLTTKLLLTLALLSFTLSVSNSAPTFVTASNECGGSLTLAFVGKFDFPSIRVTTVALSRPEFIKSLLIGFSGDMAGK